jgi:hypothetical protein
MWLVKAILCWTASSWTCQITEGISFVAGCQGVGKIHWIECLFCFDPNDLIWLR